MKKGFVFLLTFVLSTSAIAQSEVGPEGRKLLWILLLLIIPIIILVYKGWFKAKKTKQPLIKRRKIKIELIKDRIYYPDILTLKIYNTGNTAIDLAQPLLVFSNLWLKRKFRLKGIDGLYLYPLFLDPGKKHTLEVDINRFYRHDKRLKKYPKTKIIVYDVKGKRLGTKSVFLRKTLFKW